LVQRALIVIGLVILVVGLLWPWVSHLPLGRLPGDVVIDKPSFKVYVPITSMILVSALISLLLWLFRH
jgi:Protein of unknown function (DUF2905)